MENIQNKIITLIKSITENNILRLPPYDQIQLCEEISTSLRLYFHHNDQLAVELKEQYIPCLVVLAKAKIDSYFCRLDGSIAENYPMEYEIVQNVNRKFMQLHQISYLSIPKSDIKDAIKLNMESLYSDFLFQKKLSRTTSLIFSKGIQPGHNFVIEFDIGVNRPWACLLIGFDNPSFTLDIAKFFGDNYSIIKYTSLEDFNSRLAASLEIVRPLIDIILSQILSIIQDPAELRDEKGKRGQW